MKKEEVYQICKGDNFPDAKLLKDFLIYRSLYNNH